MDIVMEKITIAEPALNHLEGIFDNPHEIEQALSGAFTLSIVRDIPTFEKAWTLYRGSEHYSDKAKYAARELIASIETTQQLYKVTRELDFQPEEKLLLIRKAVDVLFGSDDD